MAKKMPEIGDYKYGFRDKDISIFRTQRGLTREVVEEISRMKEEPQWMLEFRLKSLEQFYAKPMPQWGGDLSALDFDEITYYVKPTSIKVVLGMKCRRKSRKRLINWEFRKQSKNILPECPLNTNQKLFTII